MKSLFLVILLPVVFLLSPFELQTAKQLNLDSEHADTFKVSSGASLRGTRGLIKTNVPENLPAERFPSADSAVLHAVLTYNNYSIQSNREQVGGVLQCDDGSFTYTHGQGRRNQAPVQFSVRQVKDCKIVALWHTHGEAGPHKSMFSPADTAAANQIGRPIYMADHTGVIRIFEPGAPVTKGSKTRFGSFQGVLRGSAAGIVVFAPTVASVIDR